MPLHNSDNPSTSKTPISVTTQTETIPTFSNIGQGREPIDETKHTPLFEFENETPPTTDWTYPVYSAKDFWPRPH